MPTACAERTHLRRDEIINACQKLYETHSFKDITIKDIGNATSFTRTSIYNYFHSKEEIFLALLQREYEQWVEDLEGLMARCDALPREQLAHELAQSLEKRRCLLKLMSMNHYDMEDNSRPELLAAFKRAYGASLDVVDRCLIKYAGEMTKVDRQEFLYAFFPFIYGIYPYSVVTPKQRQAMEQAEVPYVYYSIYELVYHCACQLLSRKDSHPATKKGT